MNEAEKNFKQEIHNEDGQTLVEFVLLLSIIMLLSLGFMSVINTNIGEQWKAIANVLLKDTQTNQRLDFR